MFPFCHTGGIAGFGSWGVWGWIGMGLNLLFWIALIVAVVVLIVLLVRRSNAPYPVQPSVTATNREILQARYARGEITRDEYLRMQDDLK